MRTGATAKFYEATKSARNQMDVTTYLPNHLLGAILGHAGHINACYGASKSLHKLVKEMATRMRVGRGWGAAGACHPTPLSFATCAPWTAGTAM
jgi:hypothetical protein